MKLSWEQTLFSLSPLGILLFALGTICAAYYTTFQTNQLDDLYGNDGDNNTVVVVTPPISMLMFAGPGRRIGQIGFPLVSIMFFMCAPEFGRGLERTILLVNNNNTIKNFDELAATWQERQIYWLKITSMIAFFFLAVVGLLPLQHDLPLVIKGQKQIGWDSLIHQLSAGLFFAFSIIHMGIWLRFCSISQTNTGTTTTTTTNENFYYYKKSPIPFVCKVACFVLCFLPLPTAFILHPISPIRNRFNLSDADAGGITQYALVTCIASYFASYTFELRQMMKQKQRVKEQKYATTIKTE
mmetsp:Transcript_60953/g.70095  ORF Transcript_60953/g.70095 Transcript_60953/m.70095 type:complete len:298 (+) Transcript_60953:115-1008(+)